MGKIIRRRSGTCQIEMKEINGRVTMKCRNLKRKPTPQEVKNSAQAILDSIKHDKIIFK